MMKTLTVMGAMLCAMTVVAATKPSSKPSFSVHSEKAPGRLGAIVTVKAGRIADQAVRVYSEPSHTLVMAIVDPRFAATSDGASWMTNLAVESPGAQVDRLPLGGELSTVTHEAEYGKADREVRVYFTKSDWGDGAHGERLLVRMVTTFPDFEMTIGE